MNPQDHLFVALDHTDILEAEALARALGDRVTHYKIGMGSLTNGGGALAVELMDRGKRIFMDMKFFDIPATVERAVKGHAALGLNYLTVHGDPSVVQAAVQGRGATDMKILAVTILTSSTRQDLDDALILDGDIPDLVIKRAIRAFDAGADGVIASAQEAALIRALPEAQGKEIITPGVRPAGGDLGDQKRVTTPKLAIANGADKLVVGRPIINADDPVRAAEAILAEIADAL